MRPARILLVGAAVLLLAGLAWRMLAPATRVPVPRPKVPEQLPEAAANDPLLPAEPPERVSVAAVEPTPAPVALPSWSADPSPEEFRRFLEPCVDESLCGVVLLGRERLAGAEVELWPEASVRGERTQFPQPLAVATSDARGRFGFRELEAGPYLLRVTGPGGERREDLVQVPGGVHVVLLGGACVEGVVLAPSGEPRADLPVRVAGLGEQGSLTKSETVTDAFGRYELCGLPGGVYWLVLESPGEPDLKGQWRFELAPGERRTLNIGHERTFARLSGRVLDARGAPLGIELRIVDAEGLWWTVRCEGGAAVERWVTSAGDLADRRRVVSEPRPGFEVELPPGRCALWCVQPGSNLLERGLGPIEFELPPEGLERDFVLPGIEVELAVTVDGRDPVVDGFGALGLWLSASTRGYLYRHGGRFVLRGLEPGPCTLLLPQPLTFVESGTQALTFEVAAGRPYLERELEIRTPAPAPR